MTSTRIPLTEPPQTRDPGFIWIRDIEDAYRVRAMRPFTVDGIQYNPSRASVEIRTMFELFEDGHGLAHGAADMDCSRPPTDTELDTWVRTGYLCNCPGCM